MKSGLIKVWVGIIIFNFFSINSAFVYWGGDACIFFVHANIIFMGNFVGMLKVFCLKHVFDWDYLNFFGINSAFAYFWGDACILLYMQALFVWGILWECYGFL